MAKDATEHQLFLIEFLVEKANLPNVQAVNDAKMPIRSVIEFKVLNLTPICIYQDDETQNCDCLYPITQIFRKGKSCLFALPDKVLTTPICSFPVNMSAYKLLPPGVLPDVIAIGRCEIELGTMVNALLTTNQSCLTLKSDFRLTTMSGQNVGEVNLFIRFSKLGPKVVTMFQSPHNRKPFLFKSAAPKDTTFQVRRVPSFIKDRDNPMVQCVCSSKKEDVDNQIDKKGLFLEPQAKKGNKCKKKRPCCQAKYRDRAPAPPKLFPDDCAAKRQCGCDVKKPTTYACE